jgi:hypothetical protein
VGGCRLGLAGGIQRRKPRPLLACDWASTHMLLPIGYPMGRFGPVRRVVRSPMSSTKIAEARLIGVCSGGRLGRGRRGSNS